MLANILNWIKNHKVISILLIAFFLIFITLMISPRTQDQPSSTPSPTPSTFQGFSPTPASLAYLTLASVSPTPPTFESYWSTDPLIFVFDKSLNQDSIKYQINPEIPLKLIFDKTKPKQFSLVPLTGWDENQPYTITILKSLTSISGTQLEKNLSVTLTRKVPLEPFVPPEENFY